jgi:hypothetical protein
VTPLERPALRWSGYVAQLREKGFVIETELERHDGTYKGRHARYRLTSKVSILVVQPEAAE